jgi:hypothetical protein
MAKRTAHQRLIFKVQKLVEVSFSDLEVSIFLKNFNSSDPVPLKVYSH